MIKKAYSKDGLTCRVTFKLPPEVEAQTALLCGSFTEWEKILPTDEAPEGWGFLKMI